MASQGRVQELSPLAVSSPGRQGISPGWVVKDGCWSVQERERVAFATVPAAMAPGIPQCTDTPGVIQLSFRRTVSSRVVAGFPNDGLVAPECAGREIAVPGEGALVRPCRTACL